MQHSPATMPSPAMTATHPALVAPAPSGDGDGAWVAVIAADEDFGGGVADGLRSAGFRPMVCAPEDLPTLDGQTDAIACAVFVLTGEDWQEGVQAIRSLGSRSRRIRIVALGEAGRFEVVLAAMRAGARDYLAHPHQHDDLIACIRGQLEILDPAPAPSDPRTDAQFRALSERESQVLDWMLRGHSTKQISAELGCVEKTVEYHRTRIMRKLGVSSAVQVVRLATLHGWSRPLAAKA